MPRALDVESVVEAFWAVESARLSPREVVDTSALTDTLNKILPSVRASVAAQQVAPVPVLPDLQYAMRDVQRAMNSLLPRMRRYTLHKEFAQVQDRLIFGYEESILSALSIVRVPVGVEQDNPTQIRKLLQQHTRLSKWVSDAVAGLKEELGDVSFRLSAEDERFLLLTAQSYGEVNSTLETVEAFQRAFWERTSQEELLLAISVEFLEESEVSTD